MSTVFEIAGVPVASEPEFSLAVEDKAAQLTGTNKVRWVSHPSGQFWFEVKSLRTDTWHRVQFIEGWVTCNCTHGSNNPGHATCYHACAAWNKLQKAQQATKRKDS